MVETISHSPSDLSGKFADRPLQPCDALLRLHSRDDWRRHGIRRRSVPFQSIGLRNRTGKHDRRGSPLHLRDLFVASQHLLIRMWRFLLSLSLKPTFCAGRLCLLLPFWSAQLLVQPSSHGNPTLPGSWVSAPRWSFTSRTLFRALTAELICFVFSLPRC